MKRSKPGAKYQGFALAVPFIEEIKEHIKDDKKYRSVTDFVRQATREKIENEYNNLIRKELNELKVLVKSLIDKE